MPPRSHIASQAEPPSSLAPEVRWHPCLFEGMRTGVLDIRLTDRRILSLPSQLGCRVGCTFCVSSTAPLLRNLRLAELQALVAAALQASPEDGRPIELSFTGEGEPLLNWRNTEALCAWAQTAMASRLSARYAVSGVGMDKLLKHARGAGLPVRLQVSLHTARQAVRDRLVPHSLPLSRIRETLVALDCMFAGIDLNVVLQDGVNDSDEDLESLLLFVQPPWRVLLNPLLREGTEVVAERTGHFEAALVSAGVPVSRYRAIARSISRGGIYPLLRMRQVS